MSKSQNKAVISGVGPDRPGIVAALSKALVDRGCNIEDSTMTRLADEFATILIVSCPENLALERLEQDLIRLEGSLDMTFTVKPATDGVPLAVGAPYMISVAGKDRTGITYRVSNKLADRGINITDLNAHVMDGDEGPVYLMMVEVDMPTDVSVGGLEAELKVLADELGVEIQLRQLDTVAL